MSEDIRKYINILNEDYNQLIPAPQGSVLMTQMSSSDPYNAYRLSIDLANEDAMLQPTVSTDNAVFIFYTEQAYEKALEVFRKRGYPTHLLQKFGKLPEEGNIQSPVPLNPWIKARKVAEDIRNHLNILENYQQLINHPCRFVKIKTSGTDDYKFYRLAMAMASDNVVHTSLIGEDKICIFYSDQEFQIAQKLWNQAGIKFEVLTSMSNDTEFNHINTVSPVPKNPWIKN